MRSFFALLATVLVLGYLFLSIFQMEPKPRPPMCRLSHDAIVTDSKMWNADSSLYSGTLLSDCRHDSIVRFLAESGRFSSGDTVYGALYRVEE